MKHYRIDLLVTFTVIALFTVFMSVQAGLLVLILAALEWTVSFDNAIVNAKYLQQMSIGWQKVFMTVGLLIAVVGMRFIYPIVVVSVTAGMSLSDVVTMALNHPHVYADKLTNAHGQIAMFGGVYLLMIALDFFFEEREVQWLKPLERRLAYIGKLDMLSHILVLSVILFVANTVNHDQLALGMAGVASLLLYTVVNAISGIFESEEDESEEAGVASAKLKTGMAALSVFIYLEIQDAVFSFDGVAGGFAITDKVILIAAGLGLGAMYVRTMTVQLVRRGAIGEFCYLEHGAYWAIIVLAVSILTSIFVDIPDLVNGFFGITFVGAAVVHSRIENKREEQAQAALPAPSLQEEPSAA